MLLFGSMVVVVSSLAQWLNGSLVRLLFGSMALWLIGPMARWLFGALALWLVCSCGSLAHNGSLARGCAANFVNCVKTL